jgi:menaquinone-specific isochorismate synthase
MKEEHLELLEWLKQGFFQQGAFITHAGTEEIYLARAGEFSETASIDKKEGIFLKDFYQDHFLAYTPSVWLKTSLSVFAEALKEFKDDVEVTERFNLDELYREDFNQLKKSFDSDLKKVVLISREEFKVKEPLQAKIAFIKKAISFGVGYPYGLWSKSFGLIGSTPEILYHIKENKIHTVALAGTARIGEEVKLTNSAKDLKEHQLVIEDILGKLQSFCSNLDRSKTHLLTFKEMIHLKTDISGSLVEDCNLKELVCTLSPTAALGGYPKAESLSFLQRTQYFKKNPKRYFGSALCIKNEHINQGLVCIRNIQWQDDRFFIESGGGVIAESELDKELNEIWLKRQTIERHYL